MFHKNKKGQWLECGCSNILDCPFKGYGHSAYPQTEKDTERAKKKHADKVNSVLEQYGSPFRVTPDGKVTKGGKKAFTTEMPVDGRIGKMYLATFITSRPHTIYHFTRTNKFVRCNKVGGSVITEENANELKEKGWVVVDINGSEDSSLMHAQLIHSFGLSKVSRRTLRACIKRQMMQSASQKRMIRISPRLPVNAEDLHAEPHYVSHTNPGTAFLPKEEEELPEYYKDWISSSRQEIMIKTKSQRVRVTDAEGNEGDSFKAKAKYLNHPYVIGEQYVMSESMARSLTVKKSFPQQKVTDKYSDIQLFKQVGDSVVRHDVIAILTLEVPRYGHLTKTVQAHKTGKITEMKITPTTIDLTIELQRSLITGDKIIDKYGNKGVIRVIPDKEMEEIAGPGTQVLASADGTSRRGSWGPALEMGFNPHDIEGKKVELEGTQEFHVLHHFPEDKLSSSGRLGIFEQGILRTTLGDTAMYTDYTSGNAIMKPMGMEITQDGNVIAVEDRENYQIGIHPYEVFTMTDKNQIAIVTGEKFLPYGREPKPENLVTLEELGDQKAYTPRRTIEMMYPDHVLLPAAGIDPDVKTKATKTQHFHTKEKEAAQMLRFLSDNIDYSGETMTASQAGEVRRIRQYQDVLRKNIMSTSGLHAIKLSKSQRAVATNDPFLGPQEIAVPESSPFQVGELVGVTRAPAINTGSIQFARVARKGGNTIEVNPLLATPMNLDHDGDTILTFQAPSVNIAAGFDKGITVVEDGVERWGVKSGEPVESALKKVRSIGGDSVWDKSRIRQSENPRRDYSRSLRTIQSEGYRFKKLMAHAANIKVTDGDCGTKQPGLFGCKFRGSVCSRCNEEAPIKGTLQEAMDWVADRYQGKLDSIKREDGSAKTKAKPALSRVLRHVPATSISRVLKHNDLVKVLKAFKEGK